MEMKNVLAVLSLFGSLGFLIIGFYKLLVYDEWTNKVVGGDAYNYIINSNIAIAYFVVATLFAIVGFSLFIWRTIELRNHE